MILPTITAISRDALVSVPPKLRMAAYGLGATRWETILAVILPTAARGIFGGIVLAFGRALGETMALAMLVGNSNIISVSLFSPANTLAALLANNFPEARPKEVGVLMYAALVLLAITLLVNILGSLILQRASRRTGRSQVNGHVQLGRRDPFQGVDFSRVGKVSAAPRTLLSVLLSGWSDGDDRLSPWSPCFRWCGCCSGAAAGN